MDSNHKMPRPTDPISVASYPESVSRESLLPLCYQLSLLQSDIHDILLQYHPHTTTGAVGCFSMVETVISLCLFRQSVTRTYLPSPPPVWLDRKWPNLKFISPKVKSPEQHSRLFLWILIFLPFLDVYPHIGGSI